LESLWSPTPKEVHLLAAFAGPGPAPKLAHARVAVFVLAPWRVGERT